MELEVLTSWFQHMPALTLVLARITALFVTAPVIGGAFVPATVKTLLAVAVALVLAPRAGPMVIPLDLSFILLLTREVLLGLCLGWLLSLYFVAVQMGGELINRHAGFSAAENFDPEANIGAGPMGDLLHLGLVLLFFATDGHHLLLASLARSYELMPLGTWSPPPGLGELVNILQLSFAVKIVVSVGVLYAGMPAVVGFLGTVLTAMHLMAGSLIALR